MRLDHVMAVEDDPAAMATLRRALTALDVEATFAHDAVRAWELLQMLERPAVIVIGWVMQGLDGIALCRALREQTGPQPYVILLAGPWRNDDLVAAFRAGADEYAHKPIAEDDIARRILRALRGAQAREYPAMAQAFDPSAEETTAEPHDPTSASMAGVLVAGRYRVISPLRSDASSAVWEGFDEEAGAAVAIWFAHLGRGRSLTVEDREGTSRRSLTDPRNEREFTVLEFGVTAGGISYVVTTFSEEWALESEAARTRPMRRSLTSVLPPAAPHSDPDDERVTNPSVPALPWARSQSDEITVVMDTPSRPCTPPQLRETPFDLLRRRDAITPLDDEAFTSVRPTSAPPPRGALARARGRLAIQAALLLAGACVAGASTVALRSAAPRTSVSSLPPPMAPSPTLPPPPTPLAHDAAPAHDARDASVDADDAPSRTAPAAP